MFTEKYSSFFKELFKNNNKEWFHAHKNCYENDVKAPFIDLVEKLLPTLAEWDDRILHDSKKALFRINRDIRFSKDKSPYNTLMKAGFSPGGKKSELPGYYLGIDANKIHVGGGLFMVRPSELKKVRAHIASNVTTFLNIVDDQSFKDAFGKLKGEKAKRLDKDLVQVAEKTDYIYNKQFYAFADFPLSNFYDSNRLVDTVVHHFGMIRPLNTFLNQAFD